MTTPHENPKKPDNTRPAPVSGVESGRELVEVPPAGEVVNLADARRARGLDQRAAAGDAPAADDVAELEEGDVLDGEVIDAPADEDDAGLVQRPGRVVDHVDVTDRDVVPAWLTSREAAVATAAHYGRRAWHVTAFHAMRSPLYVLRLAGRAPVGAARLTAAAWRWVADSDNVEVRRALLTSASSPEAYLRLVRDDRARSRRRGVALLFLLAALVAGALVVASGAPWPVQVAAVLAALVLLGVVGRRRDGGRIVDSAAQAAEVPPLDQELIRNALGSLGVGALGAVKADPSALRFTSPIMRDGAGYRVDVELPIGVTASEVIEKRAKLASGLRRPLGTVWPEGDPDTHEGHLVLYVADRSLSQSKPTPWPLAKAGKVNIFEPVPVGVDQRGRKVLATLIYAAGVTGAIPRMGKTFLLRLLLLAGALDPRVELHVHDLRGGADLAPLAKVAHYYRSGDDPADITALLTDARAMQKEMMRRYRVIRTTLKGDPRCPEGKVTDELASDKSLGLHPILAAYDETQVMFEHPDHGKELRAIYEDLVRRGPAAGIMVHLATQRVDDKSIPVGVSANAALRFCLKVMGWRENNMVLGDGMYAAGYSATTFSRKDLGVAYMVGEGDDPVIVRIAYIDAPAAETIADRARAVRAAQGRLTGMAAGEEPEDSDTGTILDHLLAVWPADDSEWPNGKVWSDDLAQRLAGHLPDLYDGWTGAQINAAVRPHDVRVIQVKHDGTNKRGLHRADLVAALADDAPITAAEYRTRTTEHDENGED
jgi:S-DNA-T family DNA segregation ATPase FtsK/SpoIIIE